MISQASLTLSRFYRETYGPLKHLGRSAATVEDYQYLLLKWERISGKPIELIEPRDVADFLAVVAETWRPATVNHYGRVIGAVIQFAREKDLAHPCWNHASAKIPKVPECLDDPVAYLIEEIEALVRVAQTLRAGKKLDGIPCRKWWPALILTLFSIGVRISSMMAARFEDLDLDGGTLVIRGFTQKNRKGKRFKLIPEAVAALRQMGKKDRERLFPWPYDARHRQWPTLTRHFRQIVDAAGLQQAEHPFHKLRRSCASYTAAEGNKSLAQMQLGHSSLTTTERYFDPRIVQTRQAADVLPSLKVNGYK